MRNLFVNSFDELRVWGGVVILIPLILITTVLFVSAISRLELPGKLAAIEQLRSDVENINRDLGEDALGQVVHKNMLIRKLKTYNSIWWSSVFVSNKWDDVEYIVVPKKGGK